MYCSKCGAPNADSSRFCESCGEPLMHRQVTEGRSMYTAPERNIYPEMRRTGTDGPLSSLYNTPLFMTAVILLTVTAVLVSIQMILLAANGYSTVGIVDLRASASTPVAGVLLGIIIGFVIALNVLTVLGFWFLYISGRNREKASLELAGYKLIRIVLIVYIVICFLGLAACVISIIAMIVLSAQLSGLSMVYSNNGNLAAAAMMMPALTAVIVILIAMVVLMLIMYIKAYSSAGTFKKAAEEGTKNVRISMYVAVMTIISGVVSLLAMLASAAVPGLGAIQVITSLSAGSAAVILAVWMINAKNKLNV